MNIYELTAQCRCPVDDAIDSYTIAVQSEAMVKVENILAAVASMRDEKLFQEDFTLRLARAIGATVTTVGYHSGVKTTCRVP